MQFHTKSRSYLFHLPLIVCLASGILGYAPAIAPANMARADPPPPPVEGATMEKVMGSQPVLDT